MQIQTHLAKSVRDACHNLLKVPDTTLFVASEGNENKYINILLEKDIDHGLAYMYIKDYKQCCHLPRLHADIAWVRTVCI